jgi:hypothetical protein
MFLDGGLVMGQDITSIRTVVALALFYLMVTVSAGRAWDGIIFVQNQVSGTNDDKGLTCKQRRELAQDQFDKECLPGFTGMTVNHACPDMCRDNREFAGPVKCREQCTTCLAHLRTIDNNKNCK